MWRKNVDIISSLLANIVSFPENSTLQSQDSYHSYNWLDRDRVTEACWGYPFCWMAVCAFTLAFSLKQERFKLMPSHQLECSALWNTSGTILKHQNKWYSMWASLQTALWNVWRQFQHVYLWMRLLLLTKTGYSGASYY